VKIVFVLYCLKTFYNKQQYTQHCPSCFTGISAILSGFGGLEDAFAGSNPAEAVGFFRAKKSPACLPSEGK
jgi:hypothetical protein